MHRRFADRAEFLTIYIKEAHPEDEWQMDSNEDQGICYRQPRNLSERVAIANDFIRRFDFDVPLVIDPMANPAEEAYAAWPERLYVIDTDGRVVYKGHMGPGGFDPEELEVWLQTRLPA